ncbi:MAG: chemotaxis protein CheW [Methylovulum sp.]|nr:MAG: chemotaxis protein CheW [Methylovulum sp.]
MTRYKNIELDDRLVGVIRHMHAVEEYREVLQGLQAVWDNLTLLGQMSGVGTDMTSSRQAFNQLTSTLLNQLGGEILKKSVMEMIAKAQVAIDILVRNLFERTADIGFLATDEDVRQFVLAMAEKNSDFHYINKLRAQRASILARFGEYVQKYSVYSDIVLMDTAGKVLARLDDSVMVERSSDPLIAEALATKAAYVESYRHHDLLPGQAATLGYSFRVTGDDGKPIGVLFLCFRFENEMESIFANLVNKDDWSVITLIDDAGRVVASSDTFHIPLGARMEPVLDTDYRIVRFGGLEYLATTRPTQGYQGYMGTGWFGHVMLPVQHAFNKDSSDMLRDVEPEVLATMMGSPSLFGDALRNIPAQAESILADVNRSVWNGHVRLGNANQSVDPYFSKILLREISNTGGKTKDVFERSIANLHETVVSAILQDSPFLASLAIDIMDRNLYERANDCRWWALTSAFRALLADGHVDEEGTRRLSEILWGINDLYTVYTNLILFDAEGRIVAVSNRDEAYLVDRILTEEWVGRVLALEDSQHYAVSAFNATPLYAGRYTYIYGAAVRAPGRNTVVGGVGIVFDSELQFAAMLRDALPRAENGEAVSGAFAVFVDNEGRVIACSDGSYAPGALLDVDSYYLSLKAGESRTGVVRHNGRYYTIGARMSAGYREYNNIADSSYRNDVIAQVFLPLCDAVEQIREDVEPRVFIQSDRGTDGETVGIATFHIGGKWFWLRADHVVEAVDPTHMTDISPAFKSGSTFVGYFKYRGEIIPLYDIAATVKAKSALPVCKRQVIIVRRKEGSQLGILADALGEITEISASRLRPLPSGMAGGNVMGEAIVSNDPASKTQMVLALVLDVDRIAEGMSGNEKPSVLPNGIVRGLETSGDDILS